MMVAMLQVDVNLDRERGLSKISLSHDGVEGIFSQEKAIAFCLMLSKMSFLRNSRVSQI